MSTTLTIEEVHVVLEKAIVDARLADPAKAGEFAILLTQTVADGVNGLIAGKETVSVAVAQAEESVGSELMSISEALVLRNRVAEAIQVEPVSGTWASVAAEKLLLLGYIDVPAVKSVPSEVEDGLLSRPVSGAVKQQVMAAVSERTGMIPTITPVPTSLSGLTD